MIITMVMKKMIVIMYVEIRMKRMMMITIGQEAIFENATLHFLLKVGNISLQPNLGDLDIMISNFQFFCCIVAKSGLAIYNLGVPIPKNHVA